MKRRSGLKIMSQLIGLVKPLFPVMLAAILLGTAGYLCAIFLTILAGKGLLALTQDRAKTLFMMMAVFAVMRGILHYIEQYCNHYIAFKLLALIRHKVFAVLRKLCPAKLEGRDKGNLISIITTDIELLEVFYAHTISPIVIAILTSLFMIGFIGQYSVSAAALAACGYLVVGAVIPLINGKKGAKPGMEFRTSFGDLNSFVLDALRGLDETIQYDQGKNQMEKLDKKSKELGEMQKNLSRLEGEQRSVTNLVILLFSFGMLFFTYDLYEKGSIAFEGVLICTLSMMGSFGPVVALSSLSNNLNQTLASGERVLSLLEEAPMVEEVSETDGVSDVVFTGAKASHVQFGYENEMILEDYSMEMEAGKIIGIHGPSGCGKSTFLKLLMRFWDVNAGKIEISGTDVKKIATTKLRDMESYVTQETHLFHTTIANNIGIAKQDATREEIMEAAKKASIHDFIMQLSKGYDTEVGELGDTLSGGEKQRIGIARAFLHDAPFMLLDEPTSNLDSLNEGIILKSLKEARENKTILLVSHRKSTMTVADTVYSVK